jgi:DNA polymerase V
MVAIFAEARAVLYSSIKRRFMTANILQFPEPQTLVEKIYSPQIANQVRLPVFSESVSAGFPSPADDYIEDFLDLNEKYIQNPAATFFMRVSGNSIQGISSGDMLIIDCSLTPCDGDLVIAVLNGELLVKRLAFKKSRKFLQAHSDNYEPIEITDSMELTIWGVVTTIIHALR